MLAEEVEDTDAAVKTTTELGGSLIMPAEDTPYGRIAQVADLYVTGGGLPSQGNRRDLFGREDPHAPALGRIHARSVLPSRVSTGFADLLSSAASPILRRTG